MFTIEKVRPLFTGVVTTAKKYVGEVKTAGGILLDTTRMEGSINPYQTVVSVGSMVQDVKEGEVVKINFSGRAPVIFDEASITVNSYT